MLGFVKCAIEEALSATPEPDARYSFVPGVPVDDRGETDARLIKVVDCGT